MARKEYRYISFIVPNEELRNLLIEKAKEKDISLASLVREIIMQYAEQKYGYREVPKV